MLITLIRHGAVAGRAHVFRGRSDPALSPTGWKQLEQATCAFRQPPIDLLMTSPARRCTEFATPWARVQQVPLATADDLREMDFGAWEELSVDEVRALDADGYAQFMCDPEQWCSPGGESYAAFKSRVLGALKAIAVSHAQHVGVLTHGGVIRVVLSHVLGITARQALRFNVAPATTCCIWHREGADSFLLNLHTHTNAWPAA